MREHSCRCVNVRVSKLTADAGSLQIRYDPEDIVHQVGPLLVLQDTAGGGVGGVNVGQVRQVHT